MREETGKAEGIRQLCEKGKRILNDLYMLKYEIIIIDARAVPPPLRADPACGNAGTAAAGFRDPCQGRYAAPQ
ncbi:MAG: hypothetical protein LBG06_01065, partial [Deltaproteobacteria bacterium]|nr:hypothetical protein [Deltaproteobacteria bacterium]